MKWTSREREVIALVQRGYSYKRIARDLGVSRSAVATYIHRIARMLPGTDSPLRKVLRLRPPEQTSAGPPADPPAA